MLYFSYGTYSLLGNGVFCTLLKLIRPPLPEEESASLWSIEMGSSIYSRVTMDFLSARWFLSH